MVTIAVVVVLTRGDDAGTTPRSVARTDPTPTDDPVAQVLALVPIEADVVTVTAWDAIRARLGVPDLTSDDLMSDRSAFWEQAAQEAVLLTDGLLLEDTSELMLDHGFTQDDVDWEARWSGPDGAGYALRFRDDLDLAAVQAAVGAEVGELAGATVRAADHLVVEGGSAGPTWSSDPALAELAGDLVADPAETTYLHRGCLPLNEALGPDATVEDLDALLSQHDIAALGPLTTFAMAYADDVGTAWLGPDRDDLPDRLDLVPDWPVTGSIGPLDAFGAPPSWNPTPASWS